MPVDPTHTTPDAIFTSVGGACDKQIQTGTGTLVAGVLTVTTGIAVSPNSRVIAMRVNESGTDGDELRCPAADRTVGGNGVGSITIRSFLNGVAATSDTSTIEWFILG